jgi:RHS repeat-associated protein
VRFPDGGSLAYTYTRAGRVASVATGEGRGWANGYDAAGRLVTATDASGVTTRFGWDVCDRMTSITAASGRVESYRYDGCGRVVAVERDGRVWRTEYDHAGRVTAAVDPLGAITRYEYDLAGRMVAATDALGHRTRFRYDERGNATAVIDPFGGLSTTTFDAMRHPVAFTDQLGRTTRLERDLAGRVTRQELPTGDVVDWQLDASGRMTDVRVNGREVMLFDRDRAGRPVLIHEPARNRTLTLSWSRGGRLRSLDVDGAAMHWTYDADGLITSRQDPAGRTTRYEIDAAGRIAGLAVDGWGAVALSRDPDGRVVRLTGPGIERTWDHDNAGLVSRVTEGGDDVTDLVRDDVGRVTEVHRAGGVSRYRYDAAGQLVAASDGVDAWEWQYDPAGRLAAESGPAGARRFTYDDAHQLVSVEGPSGTIRFSYDGAGRRVEESGPAGDRRYTWDGFGRLTGIETARRTWHLDTDALGQLARVGDTRLIWDANQPVPELLAIGDEQVPRPGGLAPALARTEDHDRDGRDPWGAGSPGGDGGLSVGYLGELEIDGLVWLRNRVYDPATRQFLSPDPLPGVPGLPTATNPYHYADNNPLGMVDPLGLQPMSIDQYNTIRAQETGPQWNHIVQAGLIVAGVATMFIPGLNLAGAALIGIALGAAGGAAPGIINGFQTGHWDWGAIGGGALKGAIIGGLSFGAARGLGGLGGGLMSGTSRLATMGGGALIGGGTGALSGTAGELYDLTPLPGSDGQFNPENIAVSTVLGAGTGAGGAGLTYRPPVPRGPDFIVGSNGVAYPTSQSRMAAGFDEAGFPSQPVYGKSGAGAGTRTGTEYTLPNGNKVRLMNDNNPIDPVRASNTNANGGPVDAFTGKPIQKTPAQKGMTKAEWKAYVRERSHVSQTP